MSRDFPNSVSSYIDCGAGSSIDITGQNLTLAAWIRPDSASGVDRCITKWSSTQADKQYILQLNAGKVDCRISAGGASDDSVTGATTVTTGVWHHILGRKLGAGSGTLRVFLDGIQDGSASSSQSISTSPVSLRIGNEGAANPFDGLVAEVGIWDVGLTQGEISALAEGISPRLIRPNNLKFYMPLLGTGSPEPDYSGFGNHGTINGTVNAGIRHAPVRPFIFASSYALPTKGAITDSAEVYLDLQASGTDIQDIHDTAEVYFDLQASGTETQEGSGTTYTDTAEIYVDLQPSTTDVADYVESTTVYLDLLGTGLDIKETTDTAEIYLNLQVLGGECHSTFSSEQFGEGEAYLDWWGVPYMRWSADANYRWTALISTGDIVNC